MQHFIFLYSIFCFIFFFLFIYLFIIILFIYLFFAEFFILRDHILTLFHATDFLVLHHALGEFVAILGALLSSAYLVQSMLVC